MSGIATAPLERTDTVAPWRMRGELRAVWIVWKRELIRFVRQPARIVTGLVQPVLFLLVLGTGLSSLVGNTGGFDYRKFIFPGVLAMSVLTTAIFSAVSIVWDREFGFLREMLVAPVGRGSLVIGKTLGGTTVATAQGSIMLVLAPFIGVRLTPLLVIEVFGAAALMAFGLTAFGVFVASRMKKIESFQIVMQFLLMPMLFLSGALFPLSGLPSWLSVITKFDPLAYAIDPLRRAFFAAQNLPAIATARFGSGVELFGRVLPVSVELLILAAFSSVFLAVSIRAFGRTE